MHTLRRVQHHDVCDLKLLFTNFTRSFGNDWPEKLGECVRDENFRYRPVRFGKIASFETAANGKESATPITELKSLTYNRDHDQFSYFGRE